MKITLESFSVTDSEDLIAFLCSESWPYHPHVSVTPDRVRNWLNDDLFTHSDTFTYWIILNDQLKAGYIRLFGLLEWAVRFDFRLGSAFRNQGIGHKVLNFMTQHIFTHMEQHKIESHTRADNLAMRRVFTKCGYQQESHQRQAWPTEQGNYLDAVGYAILKEDWQRQTEQIALEPYNNTRTKAA